MQVVKDAKIEKRTKGNSFSAVKLKERLAFINLSFPYFFSLSSAKGDLTSISLSFSLS